MGLGLEAGHGVDIGADADSSAVLEALERLLGGAVRGRQTLDQAQRLLAGGRVEELVWFRAAVAAVVVAPNGRRFAGWLALDGGALDGSSRVATASCACSPRLRPGTLCQHLAATLLVALAPAAAGEAMSLDLPGRRFERSAWARAAEAAFELTGDRATVAVTADGWTMAGAGGRLLTCFEVAERGAADSRGRSDVAATDTSESNEGRAWPALHGVGTVPGPLVASEQLSTAERRLIELTLTPSEKQLAARAVRSRRQALEASAWWLLARRAFAAAETAEATVSAQVAGERLELCASRNDARFFMVLLPRAVAALQCESPELLERLGVAFASGAVRPALRLELLASGELALEPVYLVERDDPAGACLDRAPELLPRASAEIRQHGPLFVLPEASAVLPVVQGRRPFAEPTADGQGSLDLGDRYRPSPLGQSLERRVVVPAGEVARFLVRHDEEIRALPAALASPELRGGLLEPESATLLLLGAEADGFRLALEYAIGGRRVPFAPIHAARRRREPLLSWEGALVDPAHPRFAWMDTLGLEALAGEGMAASMWLSPLGVCRLRSYLPEGHPLQAAKGDEPGLAGVALAQLEALSPEAPPPPPESLGISLFDFQRTGYAWLWFLWRNGFGGLLCDDMGLGKTYQAIALIAAIARTEGRVPAVLVACPASVRPHWQEKLASLAPGLTPQRGSGTAAGVRVATYGILRNEAGGLAGAHFDLLLLDEAQTIKNRETATYAALRRIEARVAIGLTGTPVENRVEELHTLLDFVIPGLLPGRAQFERDLAGPIAAGDLGARQRLARLIRPFVLRRSKEQVLPGLPSKLEDRRSCAMTPGQAEVYRDLLGGPGAELRRALGGAGPVSTLHVFALLSQLKQVCNHPDLLLPPGAPPSGRGSGKWELLVEILDEALGSGLKVVVFSQYLRALDLVARHLEALGVGFESLRGSTVDRARPVARFRDDADCRVFLASLRAAGVGIDLTAASVVIHLDRWWNQAREDQATDRVHRLGQRRGVQVVTLITEGTVEERIERLIAEKGRLAADLVPEEDAGLLRRFSREELRRLLAE